MTQINAGNGQLRLFNGFDCNVTVRSNLANQSVHNLASLETLELREIPVSNETSFAINLVIDSSCSSKLLTKSLTIDVTVVEGKVSLIKRIHNCILLFYFLIVIDTKYYKYIFVNYRKHHIF